VKTECVKDTTGQVAAPSAAHSAARAALPDLEAELLAMLRELAGHPALWGSRVARPVVERARELIARAERCRGER
jgi:hypothetical protein